MDASANRVMALCALLASTAVASVPAHAQSIPAFRNYDGNGVDVVQGDFLAGFPEGTIGSSDAELALLRLVGQVEFRGNSQFDNIYLAKTTTQTWIHFGTRRDVFPGAEAHGATLLSDGTTYRASDGTLIEFTTGGAGGSEISNMCDGSGTQTLCNLIPTTITSPDGKTLALEYEFWANCVQQQSPEEPLDCTQYWRLSRVSNSYGYSIAFSYAAAGGQSNSNPPSGFYQRTGATFHNSSAGSSALASVSYSYPSAGVTDITDTGGRVWRVTSNGTLYALRRPGASSDTTSATRSSTTGLITAVTKEGVTTNYSRSVSGTTGTMTVTNALSQVTTIVSNLSIGRPTSVTDPLNRTTSYTYDSSARLTRVTAPEGNFIQYAYDARGNITQTERAAKSGSGLATITTSASFDSTCADPLKCNQPNSTTDARGNVTEYTYDSTHGGLSTVSQPAPTSGAVRPQTRYTYTLTNGEYQLTGISRCQTLGGAFNGNGAACAGAADEAKSTFAYDSNGNVTSVSSGSGNDSLTATASATYDALGNLLTVDGPLSGSADTTRYRYNAARQLVGVISPDPDGTSVLKHRALRITYTNGLMTKVDQGTVNSQSDSDWAAFSALEAVDVTYDGNAREITRTLSSGGTVYSLSQASYDSLGRPECVAQRMNPAEFASLPASACSLDTQGSYGPDRIEKVIRDAAGRVTQMKMAVGTSDEANEVTSTYSSNGQIQTVTDAENNKTTYEYDGHDRLAKVRFPDTTKGAGTSSSSDYEQFTYDANSNVTSRRLRDGNSIGFTLDALNRVVAKNLPGSEPDVSYLYDALNRMTAAVYSGNEHYFTYDALGRNLTQYSHLGTVTSTYDLAGRRTRITHPDGFYVDQEYLVTGDPTVIRENGATSGPGVLATYANDDRGRRTTLTRGDGSVLTYTHDNVSRLTGLANDLAGTTTYDLTLGFTPNPAGGISSATRSNDLYAWDGHYNVNRNYTANGRNQYTASGSITPTYDSKGNLTSAGSTTYGYSSENLLTSATGSISASYDPLMRLYQTVGSVTTRFAYDGTNLRGEYSSSNSMLRRYVHGPGTDEPLVWYEGTGTTDRRFLHADERGSIVAVTNSSGAIIATNAYDEYGVPKSTNSGRFQYTGQTWLSELGLYYYKARMYSPTLGRFLQTDPIGYGDGMNLYAYVKADPVNFVDPSGLATEIPEDCTPETCGVVTGKKLPGVLFGEIPSLVLMPGWRPLDVLGDWSAGDSSQSKPDVCKDPRVQRALRHPHYKAREQEAKRMSRARGGRETGFNFGKYIFGGRVFGDVYPGRDNNTIIFRDDIDSLVYDGIWNPDVHFHYHPAGEDPKISAFDNNHARRTNAIVVAISPEGMDCTDGRR